MIFPFTLNDGQIVDAGDPNAHQTALVELPVFIAEAAEPVAAIVVPFVGERTAIRLSRNAQSSLINR
jgi:hypothetical protein